MTVSDKPGILMLPLWPLLISPPLYLILLPVLLLMPLSMSIVQERKVWLGHV